MLAKLLRGIYNTYDYLFSRTIFFKWNRFLYNLSLRGLGILTNAEKAEAYFLKNYLSERGQKIIFDIGANVGSYAATLRKYSPESQIYCFEPNPKTFTKLQERASICKLHTYDMALGNAEGVVKFYDYIGEGDTGTEHASLYKDVIESIHHRQSIEFEVQITTVDKFVEIHNLNRIDLLKIDTEGNELEVLKGASKLLNKGLVDVIQFEFNEMNAVSHVFLKDFMDILKNYNFYRMLKDGYIPIDKYFAGYHEIFAWQNILAVHKASSFKPR